MDSINYNFIDVEIPDFDPEFFDLWLSKVVESYKSEVGDLSFQFCSDDYLLNMNKEYLDHDYYTDVITFDYSTNNKISGDIFISYDRVKENAISFGNGITYDELCRVVVHGVLHLLGFKDKSDEDKKRMREEETKSLSLR
jgi:probable rRNA maturation factor